MWFRKRKSDPAEVIREMRERVFTVAPSEVGVSPGAGHERVWAVLMEIGYPKAVASLVAIADGTTSLYFSNGGGVIGAGEHQPVREASRRLIALVNESAGALAPTAEHPLPAVGRVRVYARTFDGLLAADADERELGENRHALSPLFHAGHAVIAAVRETKGGE